MTSAILLVIDGLGDLPTPKTPLQAAKTKHLDTLAKQGSTGLLATIAPGVVPGSDTSHLQLFGYDPEKFYFGRGPLEALGIGMNLKEGDVAFRANFGTVKNGSIIDRRAGRIATADAHKLEASLNMRIDDVQVLFKSSVEHRGVLILRGPGLSAKVSDTDPHKIGPLMQCKALERNPRTTKTARIVNKFTKLAQEKLKKNPVNKGRKLPANIVLLRGAGTYHKVPSLKERLSIRGACIAGGALYKGVAKFVGMDVLHVQGATGTGSTNLKAKAKAAVKASKKYDFVFVHVKACDSFSHDGNFKGKTKMLEKIDKELLSTLEKSNAYLIVTGDHSTPCIRKAHSGHEIPILIHGKNERQDNVKKFDEISCMQGGLGHLHGKDVMPIILNLIRKAKMYGS